MPWLSTDKQALWKILKLDRNQLENGSTLEFLMDYAEDFDLQNSTSIVTEIQGLIIEISNIKDEYPTKFDGSDRIKRQKIDGQLEVEFFEGNSQQQVIEAIQSKSTEIKNLLDPNQLLLRKRTPYARTIV